MTEDAALLRRFAEESSETALHELVTRRIDFVYAAALRQVGGDTHLAEEVAQSVFLDLACKARVLAERASITGWLYTSVRFAAAKALRSRVRRMNHETEAYTMQETLSVPMSGASDAVAWDELRPVLDAAMHELGERDREVILLRFFERRSLAEVGAATGLAENSARMRVERALEKLRGKLARRGITSTAAALGVALAGQPVVAAPAGLAAAVAGPALAGVAASGGWLVPAMEFMSTTKIIWGTMGAAAVLATSAYLGGHFGSARLEADLAVARAEKQTLAAEVKRLTAERSAPTPASGTGRPAGPRLTEVAADVAQKRAQREAAAFQAVAGRGGVVGPLTPASIESLRVLADLKNRKLANIDVAFVSPDGKLNPAFIELFGLTTEERTVLQQSVDRVRDRLAELERTNAVMTRDENGGVVITVNSFAEAGGTVYDELMKSFADTLGPERNAAYVALGATRVEAALGYFGAAKRTVTLTVNPGAAADRRYLYSARHELPQETGNSTRDFKSLKELMDYAGTVARLVPSDFGR